MAFATVANARVAIGSKGHLKSKESGIVIVFKSQQAMSNAIKAAGPGTSDRALYQYVACVVPTGTMVLVTADITGGFWSGFGRTSDVMVLNGPNADAAAYLLDLGNRRLSNKIIGRNNPFPMIP